MTTATVSLTDQLFWRPAELRAVLGVGPHEFEMMRRRKQLPDPVRFGRAPLWSSREIRAWIDAGSPPADKWKYAP